MKYPIKPKVKKYPTRKFIIFPRYCGPCQMAYYLQYVPVRPESRDAVCPECKSFLWWTKEYATDND